MAVRVRVAGSNRPKMSPSGKNSVRCTTRARQVPRSEFRPVLLERRTCGLRYRRTERGIQTMDLALDIIAEPDRRSWRWKDEDEFALLIDDGVVSAETAAQVRREAEQAHQRARHQIEADFPDGDDGVQPRPGKCLMNILELAERATGLARFVRVHR